MSKSQLGDFCTPSFYPFDTPLVLLYFCGVQIMNTTYLEQ
ncbi:hypothetical protein HMPREF1989_00696 [Porphyromonas gingivalis F0566]|nr:hypothetical protein HMPREF1989_00696 [Porphyromonas gingivalis F0566]